MNLKEIQTFQLTLKLNVDINKKSIPDRDFINSENMYLDNLNRLFLPSEISMNINNNDQEIIFNISAKKTELLMRLLDLFEINKENENEE